MKSQGIANGRTYEFVGLAVFLSGWMAWPPVSLN
jgi:hypothetical protein